MIETLFASWQRGGLVGPLDLFWGLNKALLRAFLARLMVLHNGGFIGAKIIIKEIFFYYSL